MYLDIQADKSIKQLLFEEKEYFGSLIERAHSISENDRSLIKKSLDTLINTRQQLIESINNLSYQLPEIPGMPLEEFQTKTPSNSFLTHTLIIIDAKILDLLQISAGETSNQNQFVEQQYIK